MISNTAQINTFTGGMDTDTDVNLLPNNKYRYAQDVRIVTDDRGTAGVLQSVEGAKKYNFGIKGTEEIIGTATVNDIAVVITKLIDGYNKVYRIENFNSPNLVSTVVLQGKLQLCEDADSNQLSIVLNYETVSNIKAYFTDGQSSIKVINIMSDKYIKYPGVDNPLVDADGNILNPNSIDIIPNAVLPPFEIKEIVSGNFQAGMVQYCYRLYNKHSQQTSMSSLSNIVHLDSSSISASLINHKGSQKGSYTGKGCTIRADLSTKDFDRCTIIRIFYEDNNATPIYSIIDDIEIDTTLDHISYTDTGSNVLSTMSQEEFNAFTSYAFVCNSLTSMQNRLFASNITETSWVPMIEDNGQLVEYDARAYRANSNNYVRLETANPDDYEYFSITNYEAMRKIPKQHDCINPYNAARSSFATPTEYVYGADNKLGGNGLNISYSFISTELTETYSPLQGSGLANNVGLDAHSEYINTMPIYELNGSQITSKSIYSASRQKNYADPIIASLFRSYQRDEVYRFGIVFYNSKAIPSPVLWIGDIRMPNYNTAPITTQYGDNWYSKPMGIKFTVKNFPIDAVSYEIVRCDRTEEDRTIVTQGVVTPIYNYQIIETYDTGEIGRGESGKDTNEYRPMPFLHTKRRNMLVGRRNSGATKKSSVIDADYITDNYWRFISPEVCFNGEKMESMFKDNIYLRQEQVLLSDFSTSGLNGSYTNKWNWVGMNNTAYDLANNTTIDTTNGRKDTYVTTENDSSADSATQEFYIGQNDKCCAYIQKFYWRANSKFLGKEQSITDAKYPAIIPYNAVQTGGVKAYKANIGNISYSNWTASEFKYGNNDTDIITYGPAGPCLILQISDDDIGSIEPISFYRDQQLTDYCALTVVNAKRPVIPYNGNTYSARTSSTYIPIGAYGDKAHSTVYAFGGDTYIGILDYPAQMIFQRNASTGDDAWAERKRYFGAYIPLESTINLKLSMGEMTNRTYSSAMNTVDAYMQIEPVQMGTYHSQSKPFYLYNDAYSSNPDGKMFSAEGLYSESNITSSNRVYVSQAKTTNENVDNWSVFKPADYIDVDYQYGQITNIRGIANRLYFWQDNAFGILSVNERSLIQDNNIGQLVLGTGGVLDRYDYISTLNGTEVINDRSITNSDKGIYWYDSNKNEICRYSGGGISIISKDCNVQTYMNNMFEQKTKGANSLYDKTYDEVWFRLYNKSLIYNERLNVFTSLYTFEPDFTLPFKDKVVTIKDNDFYIINSLDIDGFGDTDKDIKVQTVVNKDAQYTKVFDNIALQGEFIAPNNETLRQNVLSGVKFTTKHQTATRSGDDLNFDYREDTYRLPVPRQDTFEEDTSMSFPARMRGKYMICDYSFRSDKDYTFQMPQITTTYRYSRI